MRILTFGKSNKHFSHITVSVLWKSLKKTCDEETDSLISFKFFNHMFVKIILYKADGAVAQTPQFLCVSEPRQLSYNHRKTLIWTSDIIIYWCKVICHHDWMLSQKALIPAAWKGRKMYVITHLYPSLVWCKPSRRKAEMDSMFV